MTRTYNNTFDTVPANANARRRLMRAARLGTRPVTSGACTDAVKVVDAVRAYRAGWTESAEPWAIAVRDAWTSR